MIIDILATEFSRNSKNCKILMAIFEVVSRKIEEKSSVSLPFFIILNVHINTMSMNHIQILV